MCFFAGHMRSGGIRDEYGGFTKEILRRYNMSKYVTLRQYIDNPQLVKEQLPDSKGVYFVVYPYEQPDDMFINPGTGGHFNGRNPNIPITAEIREGANEIEINNIPLQETLWGNWVEDADILYIGRAGGIARTGRVYNSALKGRIIALLRFGNGEGAPHWGGRILWQHTKNRDFRIYWYICEGENPVELERELIREFKEHYYGKRPYANLQD